MFARLRRSKQADGNIASTMISAFWEKSGKHAIEKTKLVFRSTRSSGRVVLDVFAMKAAGWNKEWQYMELTVGRADSFVEHNFANISNDFYTQH